MGIYDKSPERKCGYCGEMYQGKCGHTKREGKRVWGRIQTIHFADRDAALGMLGDLLQERRFMDHEICLMIYTLRQASTGPSWRELGELMGLSGQAIQQWFTRNKPWDLAGPAPEEFRRMREWLGITDEMDDERTYQYDDEIPTNPATSMTIIPGIPPGLIP